MAGKPSHRCNDLTFHDAFQDEPQEALREQGSRKEEDRQARSMALAGLASSCKRAFFIGRPFSFPDDISQVGCRRLTGGMPEGMAEVPTAMYLWTWHVMSTFFNLLQKKLRSATLASRPFRIPQSCSRHLRDSDAPT